MMIRIALLLLILFQVYGGDPTLFLQSSQLQQHQRDYRLRLLEDVVVDDGKDYYEGDQLSLSSSAPSGAPSVPNLFEEDNNGGPWAKYNWSVLHDIPKYTASLSMFGSLWIVVEVLRDKKKRGLSYHRLVCALSVFDFVLSSWFLASNLFRVISEDRPETYIRACEAGGFFAYWSSLTIPIYNLGLATYFYLTINHGWREDKMRNSFEKWVHRCVPPLTAIVSFVPIPLNLYNYWTSVCFVTYGGEGRGKSPEQDDWFWGIFWGIVLTSAVCVTALMCSIYLHTYTTLKKSARFSFDRSNITVRDSSSVVGSGTIHSNQGSTVMSKASSSTLRRTRTMALLYTIPFTITWVIPVIVQILTHFHWKNGGTLMSPLFSYVFLVWLATFLPLQGFFNWIIYIFPRLQRLAGENTSLKLFCTRAKTCFGNVFAPFSLCSTSPTVDTANMSNQGNSGSSALQKVTAEQAVESGPIVDLEADFDADADADADAEKDDIRTSSIEEDGQY